MFLRKKETEGSCSSYSNKNKSDIYELCMERCVTMHVDVLCIIYPARKNVNYVIFTYVPAKTATMNVTVNKFYATFLAGYVHNQLNTKLSYLIHE
jgi:hypothetical protein